MQSRFIDAVEVSRMGVIFANNGKAYASWSRQLKTKLRSGGLTGESLERAVGAFHALHSEYVVVGAR